MLENFLKKIRDATDEKKADIALKMMRKVNACKIKSQIKKCASCEDYRICLIKRYET